MLNLTPITKKIHKFITPPIPDLSYQQKNANLLLTPPKRNHNKQKRILIHPKTKTIDHKFIPN